MSINTNYSLLLINKIRDAKKISYYELKKFFDEELSGLSYEEIKHFNFNDELDDLEEKRIISIDEGLIIYED